MTKVLQEKAASITGIGRVAALAAALYEPREILVTGPPWDTAVCVRFTDQLTAPDGGIVYANRGTILGRISWGRISYFEVHEDTQKVAEYLALHEPTGL